MGAILRPFPNKLITGSGGQVKPSGVPRIDWTHPLTKGLLCYWFDTGQNVVIDLVTGRIATKASNNVFPAVGSSRYGVGYQYTAQQAQMADPLAATNQAIASPYSVATGFYQIGASTFSSDPAYFGLCDATGNDCVMVFGNSATTFGVSYGNNSSPFSFTYANNTFYVVVGSATGPSTQASWVNGVVQTAGAVTSLFTGTLQHYVIGGGVSFNVAGDVAAPNAAIFFGATWQGRALTQADATLLYTDPYCFLLPSETELPSVFLGITAFSMTAATGNYSLTQEQEKLLKTSLDVPQVGTYSVASEQETLKKTSLMSVQETPYTLTGEQIKALKASTAKIQAGTYALTNEQLMLLRTTVAKIQAGNYSFTDEQLLLLKASLDKLQEGSYLLTHEQINLKAARKLAAQTGSYVLTGENFVLTFSGTVLNVLNIGTVMYTTSSGEKLIKASQIKPFAVPYAYDPIKNARGGFNINGPTQIQVATSSLTLNPLPCTMAAWVYVDFPNPGQMCVMGNNANTTNSQNHAMYMQVVSTPGYTAMFAQFGNGFTDCVTLIPQFTWAHVAVTIDSSSHVITYVNGVLDTQLTPTTYSPLASPFFIGNDGQGSFFSGSIADPAVWNVVLSANQILALASGARSDEIGPAPVGYWPFTGASPEPDKSGNGNNGTLTGTQMVIGPPTLDDNIARSFNGTSDYIDAGALGPSGVNWPSAITLSCWICPTSFPNSYHYPMWRENGSNQIARYGFAVKSNGKLLADVHATGSDIAYDGSGSQTLSLNTWYRVTVVYSAATGLMVYVNNTLDNTVAANGAVLTDSAASWDLAIGNNFVFAGTVFFAGYIADAAQWNIALTASQVAMLVAGKRAATVASANLDFCMPVFGMNPELDVTGNLNDGQLHGTAVVPGPPLIASLYDVSLGNETLLKASQDFIQELPLAISGENETLIKTSKQIQQPTTYTIGNQNEKLTKTSIHHVPMLPYGLNATPVLDARSFNGTSDYMDWGTHTWDPTTSATFAQWVNINSLSLPSGYGALFVSQNPAAAQYYVRSDGKIALYFANNWGSNSSDPLTGGPTLSAGQWYHLAWTIIAGGNCNFYVNGVLTGSFAAGASAGFSSLLNAWIGADPRISGNFFNGSISDIAIWDVVLSGTQIANLAAGQRANTIGSLANLISYLPIIGTSPEQDQTTSNFDATPHGTTVVAGPPTLATFTPPEGFETLLKASLDKAQTGFYQFTGESVNLNFSVIGPFVMSIGAGSYTLIGEQATVLKTSIGKQQAGTYALTNEQEVLRKTSRATAQTTYYAINNDVQSFNLSGSIVTGALNAGALVGAVTATMESPSFGYTGQIVLGGPDASKFTLTNSGFLPCNLDVGASNIPAGTYNITLTGQTGLGYETLLKGSLDKAQAGFYAFTGESVTLIAPAGFFSLSIGTGTYSLTDNQLTLRRKATLHPQMVPYNITEFILIVPQNFFLSPNTGYFSVTTSNETLLKGSADKVQTATYTLTGEQLAALKGSKLLGSAGFYTATGEQVTLKAARVDKAQTGFYNIIGPSQSLTIPGQFFMTVTTGQYAVSPESEALAKGSKITIFTGNYALVGENERTLKGRAAFPQAGFYALTPEQLTELKTSAMSAQTTTYTFTVEAEHLLKGSQSSIGSGSYSLSFASIADAIKSFSMIIGSGAYVLTVEALQITTTGTPVTIKFTASPILFGSEATAKLLGNELATLLKGEIT